MQTESDTASGMRRGYETVKASPTLIVMAIFALLLPVIVAYWILYRQTMPVPYQDDYGVIVAFAERYSHLSGLKTKLFHIVTDQANAEYRLIFLQFVVACEMELTRHLNFVFLTWFGNLFLLPIGLLLWLTYGRKDSGVVRPLFAFIPICFLFFSLPYWEALNWATTDLANIPVVFFGFLAIYLLIPSEGSSITRTRLTTACLSAALAACSLANGFFLAPVGLLLLLRRRAYAASILWCASFAAPLAAYLYHFSPLVHPKNPLFFITRPLTFLAFLAIGAMPYRLPASVLGLALLPVLWFAFRSRFDRVNPVAFYVTLWILLTAAVVAWVRGREAFSPASRYSIYSSLLLIFCYAFLTHHVSNRWSVQKRMRFYWICVVVSVTVCSTLDVMAYIKLGARREMVLTGIEFYRAQPQVNSPMIDPLVEKAFPAEKGFERSVLTQAIEEHIFTLPSQQTIQ